MNKKLKRFFSILFALVLAITNLPIAPIQTIKATEREKYPYVVYARDKENGIQLDVSHLCINGNIYTNGSYSTTAKNPNFNGILKQQQGEPLEDSSSYSEKYNVKKDIPYIYQKLMKEYFNNNCKNTKEDISENQQNINLNQSVYSKGQVELYGNLSLNHAVGAVSNLSLNGETINGNHTVLFSKFGNISISGRQISIDGFIYAPQGCVTIQADNFNLNGIIIARQVIIRATQANLNYNSSVAEMVGTTSENLTIATDEEKYLPDSDSDGLADLFESKIGTDKNKTDTDGDGLPDRFELYMSQTDPLKKDTDGNGISDDLEDGDSDQLNNLSEYQCGTSLLMKDSDDDGLCDGDEVKKYKTNPAVKDTDHDGLWDKDELILETDPNKSDTNENGIQDGEEKYTQTYCYDVENDTNAIRQVKVHMKATGNLQRTMKVQSIMEQDSFCTDVVGLVGEPFSIESTSKFDKADITFVLDKGKLDKVKLEDLMFLWYDEQAGLFKELKTIPDENQGTVTTTTTHFSKYMLVDRDRWYKWWRTIAKKQNENYFIPLATVICTDCSGSMSSNDEFFSQPDNLEQTCYRKIAIENFVDCMISKDRTSLINYDSSAQVVCGLTSDKESLKKSNQPYSAGGTNANAAVMKAIPLLEGVEEKYNRNIILLSDGDVNVTDENLALAKEKGIKINTVGIGNWADEPALIKCAKETDGQHFSIQNADKLCDIYGAIAQNSRIDFSSLPDEDKDGLPDKYEKDGIVLTNGNIIYTDADNPDTDNDGLEDGEEIPVSRAKFTTKTDDKNNEQYDVVVFSSVSNPVKDDTDGDGLPDEEEVIIETDPQNTDTDEDELKDGLEESLGYNPIEKDEDQDGYTDHEEYLNGTNPYVYDKNWTDYVEDLLKGAVFGDFYEEPDSIPMLLGQVIGDCVPVVSDVRDLIANLCYGDYELVGLNLVGLVSGSGDSVQIFGKVCRFLEKNITKSAVVTRTLKILNKKCPEFVERLTTTEQFLETIEKVVQAQEYWSTTEDITYIDDLCDKLEIDIGLGKDFPNLKAPLYIEVGTWNLGWFKRGDIIDEQANHHSRSKEDQANGKSLYGLGRYFPVVDRIDKKQEVVISTKSIDLRARSYRNPSILKAAVMRSVRKLNELENRANEHGDIIYGKTVINVKMYKRKALEVVVPKTGISEDIKKALTDCIKYALDETKGDDQKNIEIWYRYGIESNDLVNENE